MEEGTRPSQDPEAASYQRLTSTLQNVLHEERVSPLLAERLASRPKALYHALMMASDDLVEVPDHHAAKMLSLLRERLPIMGVDHAIMHWEFRSNRRQEPIGGYGKAFEVCICPSSKINKNASVSSREARSYLAERGFSGHAGAFLTWHLSHEGHRGKFACIPEDDECYVDPRGKLWVPYSYVEPGSISFHLSPIDEPWDSPFSFVGFRLLSDSL